MVYEVFFWSSWIDAVLLEMWVIELINDDLNQLDEILMVRWCSGEDFV
jgi:hypothetical protein